MVRDFDGLPGWQPAVTTSALEGGAADRPGAIRHLGMADGSAVAEVLTVLDDHTRKLVYEIVDSPHPVRFYRGTLHVVTTGTPACALVRWSITFDCDPDDTEALTTSFRDNILTSGLRGLARRFDGA
ncbi:SRPBCC family protein [Amycolatopsis ultiminotia]|uniref:SRPBCC family protein n=1 Tax=Amycolatopsis ultiminotia TaxID=543629 RepID=A0ABP6W9H1_9PSEU